MNTRLLIFAGFFLTAIALINNACKKPTPFGSELLEGEYADSEFTDQLAVECTVLAEDSVLTSDKNAASIFLCGELNDPIFGKSSSEIYSLLIAESLNPEFDTTATLDSIVLYLKYAPSGIYGDTLVPQTLRVLRLNDALDDGASYYSHSTLAEGEEIGRIDNFRPRPQLRDSLFDGFQGPILRIRLKDDFGKELLKLDSLDWLSDSTFYKKLRGLKIVCSSNSAKPGAMLAFDLNDNTLSRVAMYYREQVDSAQTRFDLYFKGTNKFTHFQHDYNGSEVEPQIGKVAGDRMYIQGMAGLRLKVTFPDANTLNQIAVNKAQLVLTVADDNPFLPPADQLIFSQKTANDSTYEFTSDVSYALGAAGSGTLKTFGGFPEKEIINGNLSVNRYRLTLSEKFQHIVDDDLAPDIKNRTVYINIYAKARSARRTVLYGPQSNTFPAKLELKYTRVK